MLAAKIFKNNLEICSSGLLKDKSKCLVKAARGMLVIVAKVKHDAAVLGQVVGTGGPQFAHIGPKTNNGTKNTSSEYCRGRYADWIC